MADTAQKQDLPPTVRFNPVQQEISPVAQHESPLSPEAAASSESVGARDDITDKDKQEIRDLSVNLQQSHVQSARMNHFVFDPVSLPASRVPSGSSSQHAQTPVGLTPRQSPLTTDQSSPLTPAASDSKEEKLEVAGKGRPPPMLVTPEVSPPHEDASSRPQSGPKQSPAAHARLNERPKSMIEISHAVPLHPKPAPQDANLPKGDSQPPSEQHSGTTTPGEGDSGDQSPYSTNVTPSGDPNDPYARAKRAPLNRNVDLIDPRFKFVKERPKSVVFPSSLPTTPRTGSSTDISKLDEKRLSTGRAESSVASLKKEKDHHHHGSMSDLKRFFKFGSKKDKEKREKSPSRSTNSRKGSGYATPPSRSGSTAALPFADDHGLEAKYGKFEKMLGSGAGGSVRLMKRADGVTFAVKQFRERHPYESEKDYSKKITAEFCVGSTLHHGNVIEALDIFNEKGRWYEVMEYAPYDLFAIVMTGKMSREEVACCSMQILNGLSYLHSMGLAHRDMKLDNVVVSEHGIMKIIDFGSAHVFRYPFESDMVLASGIVGSDPYLAPEVYDQNKYDPTKADIWSLAIIYCCMTLRRFPWKCPRMSDNSFKLFVTQPTEEELKSNLYPRVGLEQNADGSSNTSGKSHHHHHRRSTDESQPRQSSASVTTASTSSSTASQTIKGPWRLLRLLPRDSRPIVAKMLELNPKKRATIEDIVSDAWVKKTQFCRQEMGGSIIKCDNHTHVLEAGGSATPTPSKGEKSDANHPRQLRQALKAALPFRIQEVQPQPQPRNEDHQERALRAERLNERQREKREGHNWWT